MLRAVVAVALGSALLAAACSGAAEEASRERAGSSSTSTPIQTAPTPSPQARAQEPWITYTPQSGPVGTHVLIEGNVGVTVLEVPRDSRAPLTVRVDLWSVD